MWISKDVHMRVYHLFAVVGAEQAYDIRCGYIFISISEYQYMCISSLEPISVQKHCKTQDIGIHLLNPGHLCY